jgi:NADH dehydrogenase (ubiquinone) Fe-S protein 8
MSSPRALTALARSRSAYSLLHATAGRPAAAFSTSARRLEGTSPAGFRIPTPRKWNEQKESLWDQAGKYFLLTEMARGMYVLLEQFFRPP